MLPEAFAAALFLGVVRPAEAYQPRYPLGNSTTNGTVAQVETNTRQATLTKIATKSSGPGCLAEPTLTQSPTVTFVNTVPSATLSPNVHWSYDTKPVENVIPIEPKKGSELYYGVSDPSKSGHYAFVTYQFNFPSVNIDHTDHVTVEYHTVHGLTASFANDDAFKYALDTWTTKTGLVLIAYTSGCGDYSKGERCYFNVTDIEYKHDQKIVIAKGESKHPDQITNSGETEWGWWHANHDNTHSPAKDSGDAFAWDLSSPSDYATAASGSKRPMGQFGCTPPADNTHGLPAACLGRSFDQILDNQLGYTELSARSKQFLDGLSLRNRSTALRNSTLSGRSERMRRRSLVHRSFWSRLAQFFTDAFKSIYDAVAGAVSIDKEFKHDFSFSIPDKESSDSSASTLLGGLVQAKSPWGDAILLKSLGSASQPDSYGALKYMNVYCVGCGASGRAKVAGRAKWSPSTGLEQGRVELQTDLHFVLKLGVEAEISLRHEFYTDLFNYGLPGLSYGVVTIGPYVSVGARVELEAAARGTLLVGAEMGIQDSLIVVDIVDPRKNQKSGWEPYFKPVFEASGEVALSAQLGLPVGIKCGLKISTWEKAVGIVDEPSIKGVAQIAGSMGLTQSGNFTAGFRDSDGCSGILTQISWRNRLWAGLVGPDDAPVLDTKDRALMRKCIGKDTKPARRQVSHGRSRVERHQPGIQARNATGSGSSSLTYDVQSVPTELYNKTLNHKLSQLVTPTGSTRLVSCANGNLYAVLNDDKDSEYCFGAWDTTSDSEVVYDGVHRSLHYYSNTMSALGVSRLRVSDAGHVPQTSVTVALLPMRNPGGDDLYIVADEAQNDFYPVVCDFVDGSASKVFVVKDPVEGVQTLQRDDVVYSITGGKVTRCQLLALRA